MNNQNHRGESSIRAHRQRATIKYDPGTQSKPFLDFKAALIKAGTNTQERKANVPAIRAARTEAKSRLFAILSAQFRQICARDAADAAAGKEALKIVNRWSRLVFKEAESSHVSDEQTPALVTSLGTALEAPQKDALAVILETKPRGKVRRRKFDVEMCCIHRYQIPVHASNIEEAHVLARQVQWLPTTIRPGIVTRTVGIDGQAVRLVHEDLERLHIDHITGDLKWWIVDDNYDDGD